MTVLGLLAFTVLGVLSLANTREAMSGAGASIDQLGRVEQVRTNLLRADAGAAHLLLGAGGYQDPLGEARSVLVEAAAAAPTDASALAEINRHIDAYAAELEQARVGRDTPAGEAALIEAGRSLRTEVLPLVDALVDQTSERVDSQTQPVSLVPLVLSGLFTLAALIGTAITLALRFRRLINLGLTAAIVLVAVSLGIGWSAIANANIELHQVGTTETAVFRASALARGSAYDARAQEALLLIQRRSEPQAQQAWSRAAATTGIALDQLPEGLAYDLRVAWGRYTSKHEDLRALGAQGRWDEAIRDALHSDRETTGGRFEVFDRTVTETMNQSLTTSGILLKRSLALEVGAIAIGIAGFLALLCGWLGVRPRLREFT
ncbi:MAG: hypothetical protein Q4G46_16115 [Propionibacteriaceae bacterium]|nr:hypothetical protein [Propionibacteriaceae bacterium]